VIRHARTRPDKHPWLMRLLARKPTTVVAVALANKMARIAWAILVKGGVWRAPTPAIPA
jgi:transposase